MRNNSVLFKTRIWDQSPKNEDESIRKKANNMRLYDGDQSEFMQNLIREQSSKNFELPRLEKSPRGKERIKRILPKEKKSDENK